MYILCREWERGREGEMAPYKYVCVDIFMIEKLLYIVANLGVNGA